MKKFSVNIAEAALDDVARRLASTRWLDDSNVQPGSGASVAFARSLRDHWLHGFDWRALEARINREPNFVVGIDGLEIHLVHRRSSRADAVPVLLIHGWPSSFLEFIDLCDALAEPEGDAPAFHVIIPSLPGYGFSTTRPGISPRRVTAIFGELMTRLGYERFIVQGGNWGAAIGTEMAREWPHRIIGLHLNAINGSPPPAEAGVVLSPDDQALADVYSRVLSYPHFNLVCQTPLTTAHAMNDSPAGLAAWIGEKLYVWADGTLPDNRGQSLDWMVATSALYWFTGTIGSANALYREAVLDPMAERYVTVPTAFAHFAAETVVIPFAWARWHYNILRWTPYASGGHYAGLEVPEAFVGDLRAFAGTIREQAT